MLIIKQFLQHLNINCMFFYVYLWDRSHFNPRFTLGCAHDFISHIVWAGHCYVGFSRSLTFLSLTGIVRITRRFSEIRDHRDDKKLVKYEMHEHNQYGSSHFIASRSPLNYCENTPDLISWVTLYEIYHCWQMMLQPLSYLYFISYY